MTERKFHSVTTLVGRRIVWELDESMEGGVAHSETQHRKRHILDGMGDTGLGLTSFQPCSVLCTFWWTYNLESERSSVVCGGRRALLVALGNSLSLFGPQHRPLKWVCSRTWLLEPLAAEVYASQRRWWFQESWEGKVALGCWWDWPISPESPHNTGFRATSVSVAAWQISHAGNSGLYYHTRWIGSFSGLGLNRHCQFIFRSQNGPLQPWTCLQWSVLILNNTFQTWKCSIKLTCELDLPRLVLGIK